jgi:hypothetical protein
MTDTVQPSCPGISKARPYPFLVDPLSYIPTRPRPSSVEQGDHGPYVDQKELHVLYSIRMSRRPIINVAATPRDGLHIPGHVAIATPTVPSLPYPSRRPLGFVVNFTLP